MTMTEDCSERPEGLRLHCVTTSNVDVATALVAMTATSQFSAAACSTSLHLDTASRAHAETPETMTIHNTL